METEDKAKFKTMMEWITELFGKTCLSEGALNIYFQSLSSFTFEQVSKAAMDYVKVGKFMPKSAELREIIYGTSSERARVAFLSTLKATESVKSYKSVSFEDKTTHEVIFALGGWGEFCHQLSQNRAAIETRFIKWHEAAQSTETRKAPAILGRDKNYLEVCKNDVIRNMQTLQTNG